MTNSTHAQERKHSMPSLALAAIGVVFGDIGTSPLYSLKEAFSPSHGIGLSEESILGVISLLFWAIVMVVAVKYVLFVMRADNNGEGGVLALMTLARVQEHLKERYPAITAVRSAVLWYKGCSKVTPDYHVQFLETNPWIHQPFEEWDTVRPHNLGAWIKRGMQNARG